MYFQNAAESDFEQVFSFVTRLWTYNTYSQEELLPVFQTVLRDPNSFAFFLVKDGAYVGFCHGCYFPTFWMSGETCYISSVITSEDRRRQGYGTLLLDHAKELAQERHCRALILDSGFPRTEAHRFYEHYGFEKSCYGFELLL